MKRLIATLSLVAATAVCSAEPASITAFRGYEAGAKVHMAGNTDIAKEIFEVCEKEGDARCSVALATMHLLGDGYPKNSRKAIEMYEKAAQAGNVDAHAFLGSIYLDGEHTKKDAKKAFFHNKVAAEACYPRSQENLSFQYYQGDGVAGDKIQALAWIILSSSLGNEQADAGVHQVSGELSASGLAKARSLAEFLKGKHKCQ